MKKTLILVVFCLIFLLGGCWDSTEIENQFLVMGMGWDLAENPDQMILSLSSPTTTEGAPEPLIIISVAAYSVESGIHQAQEITFRTVELGHLQVLMVGEEFAKMGIQKHMDSIGRNPRIGRETIIAVVKEGIENVWQMENPATPRAVEFIVDLIHNNKEIGLALDSTFREFFEKLSYEGTEPAVAYLSLTENKKSLNANGVAVFRADKMVGTLIGNELQAFLLASGEGKSGLITIGRATAGPEEQSVSFLYRRSKTRIKTEVKDENPHIYLKIFLEGDITESTSSEPTADETVIANLEKTLADFQKNIIKQTIEKCQKEYQSDIFGFGEYFRAYHFRWWKAHDWGQEFPAAIVHVEVEVKIRRIGIES